MIMKSTINLKAKSHSLQRFFEVDPSNTYGSYFLNCKFKNYTSHYSP